jgi:ankyrin repeat protein
MLLFNCPYRFLLAKLHLDSLVDKMTARDIRGGIENLPRGLEQLSKAYDDTIARIERQHPGQARLAQKVVWWITHARRPLFTAELQEALAVQVGDTALAKDNKVIIDELIAVCAGLVTIDIESSIVRLIHYTTDEYFRRSRRDWVVGASEYIASTCLTYLCFRPLPRGPIEGTDDPRQILTNESFLQYAISYWGEHTFDSQAEVQHLAHTLLKDPYLVERICHLEKSELGYLDRIGIHFAAQHGLRQLVGRFVDDSVAADSRDSFRRTPLIWAAISGQDEVVKLLLDLRVDPNLRDDAGCTSLSYAVEHSHRVVVRLLLSQDNVDVNLGDKNNLKPLGWAIINNQESIVRWLLEQKDIDSDTTFAGSTFFWAAKMGHAAVIRLLLDEENDNAVSTLTNLGHTPMTTIARFGHKAVMKSLLELKDVDVNLPGEHGRTPVFQAAYAGHLGVLTLLLARADVDVNLCDDFGLSPLRGAMQKGHAAVVELLLGRKDVKVDWRVYNDQTLLLWAAETRCEDIANLLLQRADIDVELCDKNGQKLLHWAAEGGHESVLRLLVGQKNVDVNLRDRLGRTPLYWAVMKRCITVEALLQHRGVDPNLGNKYGESPLHLATAIGSEDIVRLLLERQDFNVNISDNNGQTPIFRARRR